MSERTVAVCVANVSLRVHRRVIPDGLGRYRLQELFGDQEDPGPDGGPMDWTTLLVLSDALVAIQAMESENSTYNIHASQSPKGTHVGYRWRVLTVHSAQLAAKILETAVR